MKARSLGNISTSLALGLALLSACGGSKAPAEEPTSGEGPLAVMSSEPGPSEAPGEASRPPSDPPGQEPAPEARVREITRRECQALAGKYGELTRSDETAKLNPKLTDAQRAQAAESIHGAAEKLEARWAESCESSLLGKVAEEQSVMCAMNARNVAAFDGCLNGPK